VTGAYSGSSFGGFQEKIPNPLPPPKFSRPYKNISKPLHRKISGYGPEE